MTYRQLTQDERYMMGQLRRQGVGPSAMALHGACRSTIWRELKRNMVVTPKGPPYCVSKAKEQRDDRLRRSRRGCQYSAEDYALVRRRGKPASGLRPRKPGSTRARGSATWRAIVLELAYSSPRTTCTCTRPWPIILSACFLLSNPFGF